MVLFEGAISRVNNARKNIFILSYFRAGKTSMSQSIVSMFSKKAIYRYIYFFKSVSGWSHFFALERCHTFRGKPLVLLLVPRETLWERWENLVSWGKTPGNPKKAREGNMNAQDMSVDNNVIIIRWKCLEHNTDKKQGYEILLAALFCWVRYYFLLLSHFGASQTACTKQCPPQSSSNRVGNTLAEIKRIF